MLTVTDINPTNVDPQDIKKEKKAGSKKSRYGTVILVFCLMLVGGIYYSYFNLGGLFSSNTNLHDNESEIPVSVLKWRGRIFYDNHNIQWELKDSNFQIVRAEATVEVISLDNPNNRKTLPMDLFQSIFYYKKHRLGHGEWLLRLRAHHDGKVYYQERTISVQ
jgi:nitrogen fixation protein FixH